MFKVLLSHHHIPEYSNCMFSDDVSATCWITAVAVATRIEPSGSCDKAEASSEAVVNVFNEALRKLIKLGRCFATDGHEAAGCAAL
jgi:hypothetical protein